MERLLNSNEKTLIALSDDVEEICKPLFEQTQINGFSYCRIQRNGYLTYLASSSQWTEHMFEKKLYTLLTPNNIPEIYQEKYLICRFLNEKTISNQSKE